MTAQQQTAALFAIEQSSGNAADDGFSVEGFTAVEISQGDNDSAHLRFGQSDAPATAYAYMPGRYDQAGDLWFGRNYDYTNAQAGNYAWHTVLHEIGHALGLKHGHEVQNGQAALAADYDSLEYSVMTYRSYEGGAVGAYTYSNWSAPQTYMMADIAALQTLYGADYETHAGDTIYSWRPDSGDTSVDGAIGIDAGKEVIFATIWDGGGIDTYDLSAYEDAVSVDLNAGAASTFADDQLASLGRGHSASGNIYNALMFNGDMRSLIENAIGGAGNDTIRGNQIDNALTGNDGNDILRGGAGTDSLSGEQGRDRLFGGAGDDVLTGGQGRDIFHFSHGGGADTIADFSEGSDRLSLSGFDFADAVRAIANAQTVGDDLVIAFDDRSTLTIADFGGHTLDALDFVFML